MATVNKDFKIKSGLIVEGTTGTINGFDILTKNTSSDEYIVDLIGGETLITSVESTQLQVIDKKLSVKAEVFDDFGSADAAEAAANTYTDGEITTALATAQGYADTAETDAVNTANAYTDTRETAITTAYQSYADTAETDAKAYTDTREISITSAYQLYADTAETDAVNTANAYTDTRETAITTAYQSYADTAEQDAKDYADQAVANLVDSAPATLDTLNELAAALQDNPDIIGDLQDIAAGKQDTLTAGANIDITGATISVTGLDTDDVSEGTNLYFTDTRAKDAVAAALGTGIEYESNIFNVKIGEGLEFAGAMGNDIVIDRTTVDAWYDASGSADDAETAANTYTDTAIGNLDTDDIEEGTGNKYFTDTRAQFAAADLLTSASLTNITITGNGSTGLIITAENGVGDSTTDDLDEGSTNLYFTDARAQGAVNDTTPNFAAVEIDLVAKQVASTLDATTAGIQVAHSFDKTDYRSAEYLVKVAYGTHTEISKVLLTLDTSDNIAITEYGIVGTNGSASSISADISGTNVRLLATTTNNNSTVTVMGTLLV
jgi:hypothetical protein